MLGRAPMLLDHLHGAMARFARTDWPVGTAPPAGRTRAVLHAAGELEERFVEVDLTPPPAGGGPGGGRGGSIDLGGGGVPGGPLVINLERLMGARKDVRTLRVGGAAEGR